MAITLDYLGLDPHSENPDDYAKAAETLKAIQPYVRYFHSSNYINDIANGEICLSIGWSGDLFIAEARAAEAGGKVHIGYSIPKEGTIVWIDNLAIPADAPHPENAHVYINYLLDGRVAARAADRHHPGRGPRQPRHLPAGRGEGETVRRNEDIAGDQALTLAPVGVSQDGRVSCVQVNASYARPAPSTARRTSGICRTASEGSRIST